MRYRCILLGGGLALMASFGGADSALRDPEPKAEASAESDPRGSSPSQLSRPL